MNVSLLVRHCCRISSVWAITGLLSQMSLAQILRNFAQNKNNPALYLQTWKNFKKSIFCGIQSMSDFQTQSQGLKFKTYINEFSQGRNLHFYFGNDDHTSFSSRGQLMESSPAVALHWKQLEMEELESFRCILAVIPLDMLRSHDQQGLVFTADGIVIVFLSIWTFSKLTMWVGGPWGKNLKNCVIWKSRDLWLTWIERKR